MARRRWDPSVHIETDFGPSVGDRGVVFSADGLRAASDLSNLRPEKRSRLNPTELDDSFADWTPVNDEGDDEADGLDNVATAVASTVSTLDIDAEVEENGGKRKRYQSSA
ncbi:hypothetical protein R3P38DRAFT_3212296 [Favolaschia claudopus]|uniref:Uncharacterized protein n=1 Tax=Favolaschia claudopus TaxID=2862362 RepID=A0AAW0AEF3_9AGAR